MLIFDRSKEQKYDVLVAEVITQRGLNPERQGFSDLFGIH